MKKYYSILENNSLFSQINPSDYEPLLSCLHANYKTYTKNSIILLQGDELSHIGIVLDGSVDIVSEDYMGNQIILNRIVAGGSFAETYICAGIKKSPVTILCEKNCHILYVQYSSILTTCSSSCTFHHQLINNMVENIAGKNLLLTNRLTLLSKRSIRSKLATYLINEIQLHESLTFFISFNRNELADYLCVNRSALSRLLSQLKKEGILSYRKNAFTIISPSALFSASLEA